jgi:hypothetical protein
VLAELSFRDLVPAIWLPTFELRREREVSRWRLHLVKHRSTLRNRVHSTLITFGHQRHMSVGATERVPTCPESCDATTPKPTSFALAIPGKQPRRLYGGWVAACGRMRSCAIPCVACEAAISLP